ncbi:MAG: ComEA family DNA-binding protein [Acidimicrobiales bacterium]|nr:ComEA family DNA-binding protein [Acidimicrobiales bacterium]
MPDEQARQGPDLARPATGATAPLLTSAAGPGGGALTVLATLRELPARVLVAVALLVAGLGVAIAVWLARPQAPAPELRLPSAVDAGAGAGGEGVAEGPGAATTAVPEDLVVQAAGAVARPGVYRLPAGARVVDLIDAAGGLAADADPDRVLLAAALADGERVHVPRVGEPAVPAASPAGAATPGPPAAPVNLNEASVVELDALPGVGPATAAAIVAHREAHGPFRAVEQLLDVRGIGPARLEGLRDLVTV